MPRLVKRYGNRKLYDTHESRYVTLDDISTFVKGGEDIRVIDNDTSEDLTAVTFAQIILEEERRSDGFLSVDTLRRMIQQGESTIKGLAQRVEGEMENIRSIGEKAGRRVQEFVRPPSGNFVADLLRGPQKRLEELQNLIDDRVKGSVEALRPSMQKELGRIESSIQRLEEALRGARDSSSAPTPKDAATEEAAAKD